MAVVLINFLREMRVMLMVDKFWDLDDSFKKECWDLIAATTTLFKKR